MKSSTVIKSLVSICIFAASFSLTAAPRYRLSVTYGNPQAQQKKPAPKPVPKFKTAQEALAEQGLPFNARNVYSYYMDDTPTRHLFRKAVQWPLINKPADTAFKYFFYGFNELLPHSSNGEGIFDRIKKLHNEQIEAFSRHAMATMFQLSSDPAADPKYTDILNMVIASAKDTGFSSLAIKNMEVYTSNDPNQNAFTVSGNNERIIVVIHVPLVVGRTDAELKKIMDHELGHIWSLHSVVGMMHDMMANVIIGTYIPSVFQNGIMPQGQSAAIKMQDLPCSSAQTCGHNKAHAITPPAPAFKGQANINKFANAINEGVVALLNTKPEVKFGLVQQYIALLVGALVSQNGKPESINFFLSLLKSRLINSEIEINPVQLAFHINQALMAVSRAQEDSCDRYAIAHGGRLVMAESMAKLFAYLPDPKNRKKLKAAINMIEKQVERYKKRVEGTDTSAEAGSTHTSTALRVVDILNTEAFPLVVFSKPYLKLLLMEDAMNTANMSDRSLALQNDLVALAVQEGLAKKINNPFNDVIEYFAFNKAALLATANAIKATENAATMADAIGGLEADATYNSPILLELEAKLKVEFESKKSAIVKNRLEQIQKLIQASSVETLSIIQRSAQPAHITKTVSESVLPLSGQHLPINPMRADVCHQLLAESQKSTAKTKK